MVVTTKFRRGFTFLEVMFVVVLIGIMMAIAIPNMEGPRASMLLKTTARDLVTAGYLARQTAMSQNYPTYMYVDEENHTWQLYLLPELDRRDAREYRDGEPASVNEELNELNHLVRFKQVTTEHEVRDEDERLTLTFYPNGSTSGMAIMLENSRDKSLTVDFDAVTGRPEIYTGEPKTMVQKLKEQGINPAAYGLEDPDALASTRGKPGEGFRRTAGMSSEERVEYYTDAVSRIQEKSQARYWAARQGANNYYAEKEQ